MIHAHTRPRRSRRASGAALLVILILAALAPPAAARIPPLDFGVGLLRFRDARLDDLYGDRWAPVILLRGERWHGFHPALVLQFVFADREEDPAGFVTSTATRLRFLPAAFQMPLEWRPHPAWALRAGPQVAWAWYREEWEARATPQEVSASGHGSGGWLAGGAVLEIARQLGGAGALTIGFEWLSAQTDRATLRGNPARESAMTGGWTAWRLAWTPPWSLPREGER